jgi:hypothetical protein
VLVNFLVIISGKQIQYHVVNFFVDIQTSFLVVNIHYQILFLSSLVGGNCCIMLDKRRKAKGGNYDKNIARQDSIIHWYCLVLHAASIDCSSALVQRCSTRPFGDNGTPIS